MRKFQYVVSVNVDEDEIEPEFFTDEEWETNDPILENHARFAPPFFEDVLKEAIENDTIGVKVIFAGEEK